MKGGEKGGKNLRFIKSKRLAKFIKEEKGRQGGQWELTNCCDRKNTENTES